MMVLLQGDGWGSKSKSIINDNYNNDDDDDSGDDVMM